MSRPVSPKEANNIIKALEAGVVPNKGVQHLLVGRNEEVEEVILLLDRISEGDSDIRFWVGDFGSGKSFMLRTIERIAIQKGFVSSTVDLTPSRRFQASDGKARALYTEIVNNIITQTSQDGNTLNTILEEWITKLASDMAKEKNVSIQTILSSEHKIDMQNRILDTIDDMSGISFLMGNALVKYYEGLMENDRMLRSNALRWLRGDIGTKTEAKKSLGISDIITDDNWYDAIKKLSELFVSLGYAGFVVNFDEAVNLYKLSMRQTRARNYERILNIYNECKSNQAKHLFINFGATRKTVFDEQRGFVSYQALKGRLGDEKSLDSQLINTNRTVLPLKPLTNEEIYTLLSHLITIYNTHYKENIELNSEEIQLYMEEQLNRPGAAEFLTPRAVIKDYIEILDLIRQNKEEKISDIILNKFGSNKKAVIKDFADTDDEIEVL